MWTSERNKNLPVQEAAAELGTVTLGGDPAGVSLGGERRWLNVYSPGGYTWRPTAGEKVLVLKAGCEGESPCVIGTIQEADGDSPLGPGEVRLKGGESTLYLGKNRLELTGEVYLNGQSLRSFVEEIVTSLLR